MFEVTKDDVVIMATLSLHPLDLLVIDHKMDQIYLPFLRQLTNLIIRKPSNLPHIPTDDHPGNQLIELQRHAINRLFEMLLPHVTLLLSHYLHDLLPVLVDGYHQNGRNRLCVLGQMLVDLVFQQEETY